MIKYEVCKKEIENQIKSGRSLIYITSFEEPRVNEMIQLIAGKRVKPWTLIFWDIASGATTNSNLFKITDKQDQIEIIEWYSQLSVDKDDFCILVLHDFYRFLAPEGNISQIEIITIRALKNLVEKIKTERKCIIITAPIYFLPNDFEKSSILIDIPLPEKELIENKIQSLISQAKKKPELKFKSEYSVEELEYIIRSFQGLTFSEIESLSTYLMLTEKQFDPKKILLNKKDIIQKSGVLTWIDNLDINLDQIGGFENLKKWLYKRKDIFSDDAKQFGLPSVKGICLIGCQGTGKSYIAKCISSFWKLPLVQMDVGSIFGSLMGSSESNIRKIIQVAEALSPCCLFIDEIEKGFSNTSASSDSGTSNRVLATFLSWLQDRKSEIFIIATANSPASLPPELIRKGRFDEIFFSDLPNEIERKEIFKIHLNKRNYNTSMFDLNILSDRSSGYSGAEIEQSIISAQFEAFSDNKRTISTIDIVRELECSVPLSITMEHNILEIRKWANGRARSVSNS